MAGGCDNYYPGNQACQKTPTKAESVCKCLTPGILVTMY